MQDHNKKTSGVSARSPRQAVLDHGFIITAEPDDKTIHFAIDGSGIGGGAWVGLIMAGVFFGVIFTIIVALSSHLSGNETLIVFGLIFAGILGLGLIWDLVRRQLFAFSITEDDVLAPDGQLYNKSNIAELLIRNKGTTVYNAPSQSTTFIAGTGLVGTAMAASAVASNAAAGVGSAIGQSVAMSLEKRSNEVCIRYGKKVVPLARYLDEDNAIALFNSVQKLFWSNPQELDLPQGKPQTHKGWLSTWGLITVILACAGVMAMQFLVKELTFLLAFATQVRGDLFITIAIMLLAVGVAVWLVGSMLRYVVSVKVGYFISKLQIFLLLIAIGSLVNGFLRPPMGSFALNTLPYIIGLVAAGLFVMVRRKEKNA